MNWEKSELGKLVNIRTGKLDANAADIDGDYPFFTCAKEISRINAYAFDCECVLVAGNGDLNVKYYDGKFNAYQRTYVVESKDRTILNVKFLYYFLENYIDELRSKTIGGVIKYIKLENLTEPKIPLPPLPTQKAIAEKLDKADALRKKDQELLKSYDELAQSVFIEMFGDPVRNEKGWEVCQLEKFIFDLVDVGSNGSNDWVSANIQMKDTVDYALMIRTTNFSNNDFEKDLKFVSETTYNLFKKTKVFGGEVIMNKIGSAGDYWIMPYLYRPVSLGLNQFMFKLNDLEKIFFYYYFKTDFGRNMIKSKLRGAITKSITKSALKELEIFYPPLPIQQKFAQIIENIEAQKALVKQQAEESEHLFQSLLQESFN